MTALGTIVFLTTGLLCGTTEMQLYDVQTHAAGNIFKTGSIIITALIKMPFVIAN